ncbi:MAG: VanZ family protein [Deltaproteobacteria bacterium]|nr:VanZ family protein [Deltaproteobacteria bacterium]NND28506.1 VanZ family protein [Myxococcales bacterium]MBT8463172.1 VanZ family protein [Deltaproteobacteria bacterium]MBT8482371.1 VanZ family protein [Deltaproteobacteria bacterium]NNK07006.1 VanZ family protein [Myxococcales bacterium]
MALIFVLSSFEVDVPGLQHVPLRDKGIHFVEYAVLGWLCASASRRSWPLAPAWRTAAFAVFVSLLWGLSDEIHQALVPGRSAELNDLVADLLGSVAGAVGSHLLSNRTVS